MIPFIDGNSSSIPEPEVNLGNLEAKYVPPQEHTSHEGNQKGINFFLEFPIFDSSKVGIHMRGGVGKSFKPQPPLEDPQIAEAPRFPSIPGPKVNRTEANPIREGDLR